MIFMYFITSAISSWSLPNDSSNPIIMIFMYFLYIRGKGKIRVSLKSQRKSIQTDLQSNILFWGMHNYINSFNTLQLQSLVPVHQFDKLPSYYIFAGLVFIPLIQPYLHEYGEDWYNTSPRRLCERALREFPKKPGEQLVILSQVCFHYSEACIINHLCARFTLILYENKMSLGNETFEIIPHFLFKKEKEKKAL